MLDPFCFNQFEEKEDGTPAAIEFEKEEFTQIINQHYIEKGTACLSPGYAPFCKHIFIENFTPAVQATAKITDENRGNLLSAYEARRENELAVLVRWFPKELIPATVSKYLDVILYSYAQVQAENESMNTEDPNKDLNYDYAIISGLLYFIIIVIFITNETPVKTNTNLNLKLTIGITSFYLSFTS